MSEMAKGYERGAASSPKLVRKAHVGNRNGRKLAIGIDPSGRVHFGKDNVGGDHAVAVLGENISDAHLLDPRANGASYVFAGPKGDDLRGAMERIGSIFGVRKLLLEGGGAINGAFLKHGLIDEFSTLIFRLWTASPEHRPLWTTTARKVIGLVLDRRSGSRTARRLKAEWSGCVTP
jgi:riboflavin biosynthesis pyrimidine reductase